MLQSVPKIHGCTLFEFLVACRGACRGKPRQATARPTGCNRQSRCHGTGHGCAHGITMARAMETRTVCHESSPTTGHGTCHGSPRQYHGPCHGKPARSAMKAAPRHVMANLWRPVASLTACHCKAWQATASRGHANKPGQQALASHGHGKP